LRAIFQWAALSSVGLLLTGCASLAPHGDGPFDQRYQRDQDQAQISMPEESEYSGRWTRAEGLVIRPVLSAIDLPGHVRTIGEWLGMANPVEAQNVNSWDEVPDSSWFTNRIGRHGPGPERFTAPVTKPPDTTGKWTVVAGKASGVTAGFIVLDAANKLYFVKFDPPGFEGLITGAEMVSSLILHWSGYNVPDNYLVNISPSIFKLGEKAKVPGEYGVKRRMTQADLDKTLERLVLDENGEIRVLASRGLEGKPLGPFKLGGQRPDDPNDRFPHEHRRELRGYHFISAWLNNPDVATKNTLDMYIGEPGEGYVRHNILDFGSSLGSAGDRVKRAKDGYALFIDHWDILHDYVTLGFTTDYWEQNKSTDFTSVGMFEWENFDPQRWAPWWSNPTFESLTNRDAFWATRIIMEFTAEQIRAIVEAAQYPEEGAAEHIVTALLERQRKFGATWFRLMTPLDDFTLHAGPSMTFRDLAVVHNIDAPLGRSYSAEVESSVPGMFRAESVSVTDGSGSLHLTAPGTLLQGSEVHFKVHLEVHGALDSIGDGVEVYIFCSKDADCVISGIER
jgi:hypothetical protein